MPVISIGNTAAAWCIQQLSDLVQSDVKSSIKMQEAGKIMDSMAVKFVETNEKESSRSKM